MTVNLQTTEQTQFGPEYPKIQTLFKRDERNVIIPSEWSVPEFAFLARCPWRWTEKIDGTNIRLHWNGETVTVGGRTDNAQVPTTLLSNLAPLLDTERWRAVFPDATDVTVYGEGYGAKIQKGGQYRPDQAVIVFDVLVGRWWLDDENVADVASRLGFDVVPWQFTGSLDEAWGLIVAGVLTSEWPDARIEGVVGRPAVDLFNRRGERVMAKAKVKDWQDYRRRGGASGRNSAANTTATPTA
jgi:hypothetical protein